MTSSMNFRRLTNMIGFQLVSNYLSIQFSDILKYKILQTLFFLGDFDICIV
jgi:hypothetical protein